MAVTVDQLPQEIRTKDYPCQAMFQVSGSGVEETTKTHKSLLLLFMVLSPVPLCSILLQ